LRASWKHYAGLQALVNEKPARVNLLPALAAHTQALTEEIRPLRGAKDTIGSDIRFPFYAKLAGFQLMCDSGVRAEHMLNYPLTADDYGGMPEQAIASMRKAIKNGIIGERKRIKKILNRIGGAE